MTELVLTVRRPTGSALVYRFSDAEITVGRDRGCTVHLPHESISGVHLRFVRHRDGYAVVDSGSTHGSRLRGSRLKPGKAMPVRDADPVALGPYIIEVFLDEGGGLTTDSRDTDRLAEVLARSAHSNDARWRLWVIRGGAQDTVASLSTHAGLWIGAARDCDLPLPDRGVAPRHAVVRWGSHGPEVEVHGPPIRVAGRKVRDTARINPGDTLVVGDAVLRLDGPDAPPRAGGSDWSALEIIALLGAFAGLGIAAWILLG
jgi:predicted component of type VI protein secretion system